MTTGAGVEGEGFLAKAITFRNTAGAVAQQAVALRVSADKCALYQCSVEGFQVGLFCNDFETSVAKIVKNYQ